MLTNAETFELLKQAKNGNDLAKEKLITINSPLIKSVVKRYINKGVEYDDLYQLGAMGFVKAINNYDASFNVKFTTYAVPMIAGEIKRFMRDDGSVKVSRSIKHSAMQIKNFMFDYCKDFGTNPSLEVIAKHFSMDVDDVVRILCNHLARDDLHVLGKHDEVDAKLLEERHLLRLELILVALVDREAVVRDSEALGNWAEVLMVAYYAWDLHLPLTRSVARKNVEEAMVLLAHEKSHPRLHVAEVDSEFHIELLREDGTEIFLYLIARNGEALELPLQPHEQDVVDPVHVLVCIYDVSVVDGDEVRDLSHDTLPVRTVQKQLCGSSHGNPSVD